MIDFSLAFLNILSLRSVVVSIAIGLGTEEFYIFSHLMLKIVFPSIISWILSNLYLALVKLLKFKSLICQRLVLGSYDSWGYLSQWSELSITLPTISWLNIVSIHADLPLSDHP